VATAATIDSISDAVMDRPKLVRSTPAGEVELAGMRLGHLVGLGIARAYAFHHLRLHGGIAVGSKGLALPAAGEVPGLQHELLQLRQRCGGRPGGGLSAGGGSASDLA
jgi:hypothetical protein